MNKFSPLRILPVLICAIALPAFAQTNVTRTNVIKVKPAPAIPSPLQPGRGQGEVSPPEITVHDWRLVAGKKLDLGVIHEYTRSPQKFPAGRPLAHWKKITKLMPLGSPEFSGIKCAVTIDGETRQIYLAGLDKVLVDRINAQDALAKKLKAKRDYIATEKDRLKKLDRETPSYGVGNAAFQVAVSNNRAKVDQQISDLQAESDALETLSKEYLSLGVQIHQWSDYAYFTGKKLGGIEMWDCGIKLQ